MRWEYLSIRFDFEGRGITQEFNLLDRDGERLKGWTDERGQVAETLPELLELLGNDGWELATHVIHSDEDLHYMHFKRPKDETSQKIFG